MYYYTLDLIARNVTKDYPVEDFVVYSSFPKH